MHTLPEKKMTKIALSGVMGAGKSTVIEILKEAGIPVIDCDRINHELLQPGEPGYTALLEKYGSAVLLKNGELQSAALSDLMFGQGERENVEHILHPMIKDELMRRMDACGCTLAVAEIPLLFEIGWQKHFDETWVVACDEQLLLKRLEEGRGIAREEAGRRLSAQLSQQEKIALCDVVLYNNADKEALKEQVLRNLKRAGEGLNEG